MALLFRRFLHQRRSAIGFTDGQARTLGGLGISERKNYSWTA